MLIFCGAILAFGIALPPEFIGLDARYALFAKEMLQNGLSSFPTTFSTPYPDYPATTVLPIVWLSTINGAVTPFTAILPTAVVSGGILVCTYLIGALRSRMWGLGAVFMGSLTLAFFHAARSVSPDQWISLATVVAFYLVYSAQEQGHRRRLWMVPVLFLFGFACRGPIGLVIPAGVVMTLCVCARRYKAAALWSVVAVTLLSAGCGALLLAAEHQDGASFAQRVWEMEVAGRLTSGGRGPAYYWLTAFGSYAVAYPIALLVTTGMWHRIARRDSADVRLLFSLVMCALVLLTGMSIPMEKKARYILSIVPFVALLAAYCFVIPESRVGLSRLRKVVTVGCAALPWIAGVACALWGLLAAFGTIAGETDVPRAAICTIVAVALAVNVRVRSSHGATRSVYVLAVGAASLATIHIGVIEPTVLARETSARFARRVEEGCATLGEPIVFYRLGPDHEDVVLAANMIEPFRPRFIESPAGLRGVGASACIIAAEDTPKGRSRAEELHLRVLSTGTLGGTRVVLCRMREGAG